MKRFLFKQLLFKQLLFKHVLLLCCAVAVLLLGGQPKAALAQPADTTRVIMTLSGENFTPQSSVFIGTTQYTPEYVSPNTLRISVLRSVILAGQTSKNVRVVNPSAGGGASRDVPIVLACRAANAVFAEVNITMQSYTYHLLDSAKYAASANPPPISDNMSKQIAVMGKPYVKKTSMSGNILNDGNAEIRFENIQDNEPALLPAADQIKYSILKTATDSIEVYSATNVLITKIPAGSKPFKPIVDKVNALRDAVLPLSENPPQTFAAGPGPGPAPGPGPITLPTDSTIARSAILLEAWSMGFPIQRLGTSPRYRITLDKNVIKPNDLVSTVSRAQNEDILIYYNSATDVIEEIRTMRGNPKTIVHRVLQDYSFDANNRMVWKSKVSYSYYDYEGIPMIFANADVFEQFNVRMIK